MQCPDFLWPHSKTEVVLRADTFHLLEDRTPLIVTPQEIRMYAKLLRGLGITQQSASGNILSNIITYFKETGGKTEKRMMEGSCTNMAKQLAGFITQRQRGTSYTPKTSWQSGVMKIPKLWEEGFFCWIFL